MASVAFSVWKNESFKIWAKETELYIYEKGKQSSVFASMLNDRIKGVNNFLVVLGLVRENLRQVYGLVFCSIKFDTSGSK